MKFYIDTVLYLKQYIINCCVDVEGISDNSKAEMDLQYSGRYTVQLVA